MHCITSHYLKISFCKIFCRYYHLCLCGTKYFVLETELYSTFFFIWFGLKIGVTVLKILCFWCSFYKIIRNQEFFSYSRYIIWNSNKNSPLRTVHQYIFPTQCNILHNEKSKYTIYDINYRRDISFCMSVLKETTKNKTLKEKKCKTTKKN